MLFIGWTKDMLILFEKIVKRFVVLVEEWIDPSFCVITTHNLLHISEDIKRFGLPDNYWYIDSYCLIFLKSKLVTFYVV